MNENILANVLIDAGERKQKWNFYFLLLIICAIVAMTAIIVTPIVQTFVSKKTAVVAEWTDGLTPQAFGTETWAGTGSEADAFKIATATDLAQLACNVNAGTTYKGMYFTLTSELNLAGREWTPIGTMEHPFMGTFDGAQKAIYFMTMTGDKYDYYGLFGVVKETLITKVDMRNSYVNVGGLATGGIIGYAENASVSYSTNGSEDIEKMGFPTNELTEYSTNSVSSIETWFNQAQKRGELETKGTLGNSGVYGKYMYENQNFTKQAFKNSSVSGTGVAGGIVGKVTKGNTGTNYIWYCWSTGSVTCTGTATSSLGGESYGDAGGIAGWIRTSNGGSGTSEFEVVWCASAGSVSAYGNAGGLVGYSDTLRSSGTTGAAGNWIASSYAVGICSATKGNSGALVGKEYRGTEGYLHFGVRKDKSDDYYAYYYTSQSLKFLGNDDSAHSHCNTSKASTKTYQDFANQVKQGTSTRYITGTGWTTTDWQIDSTSTTQYYDSENYRNYYLMLMCPKGTTKWTKADSNTAVNNYHEYYSVAKKNITLDDNGGSGGSGSISGFVGDTPSKVSVPTRTGYTFNGYYSAQSGGTQYVNTSGNWNSALTSSTPTTLYAQWTGKSYTVTLNRQNGSGGTSSVTATYGQSMPSATAPTRTGYTFKGYYTSTGGSGTQYYTSKMTSYRNWNLTSNTTLYAYWSPITPTVTLSATDADGYSSTWLNISYWTTSTTSKTASKQCAYDSSFGTMPTPIKKGYHFDGWFSSTSSSATEYKSSDIVKFLSNTTLYAKWTQIYTLTINTLGGTYTSSTSVEGNYGNTVTLGSTSRTGYTFGGWKLSGAGSLVNNSGTYVYTFGEGNDTITAQWDAVELTITLNCTSLTGEKYMVYILKGDTVVRQLYLGSGQTTIVLPYVEDYANNQYTILFTLGQKGTVSFTGLTNATASARNIRSAIVTNFDYSTKTASLTYTITNSRINSTIII